MDISRSAEKKQKRKWNNFHKNVNKNSFELSFYFKVMCTQYISDEEDNKNPFIDQSAESTSSIGDFINDGEISEAAWTPANEEKVRNYSNFPALVCNQLCGNMILTFIIFKNQRPSSSSSSSNIGFTVENYGEKEVSTLCKNFP